MVINQERRWYFWLAIVIVVLTTAPYLYGFSEETDQMRFSGSFIGVEDQNTYIAKMRSGYNGEWLFRTPYTGTAQTGIVGYSPYILIGKLAGGKELFGQFQFFFQGMRIASIFIYVFSLRRFFSRYIQNNFYLKFAVFLSVFGGGFGWLYFTGLSGVWQNRLPLEFYSPDAFSFLAVLILPHIILARSFLLLSIDAWIFKQTLHLGKLEIRYPIVCGVFGYLVFLFQPINFSILLLLTFFYILFSLFEDIKNKGKTKFGQWIIDQRIYLLDLLTLFLIYLPVVGYNFYILLFDPFVKSWSQQNILMSPPITDYLLGYLVWMVLGFLGFPKRGTLSNHKYLFWGLWVIAGLGMVYFPISIQRRYIEGIWVVIVLLAIKGIERRINLENHRGLLRAGVILASFSSVILLAGSFIQLGLVKSPVFVEKDHIELFQYLDSRFPENSILFADHALSNEIPAWTNLHTIVGHGPESIGEQDILDEFQKVVDGQLTPEIFIDFLKEHNVSAWILERQMSGEFPACKDIYHNESFVVCLVGGNE